MEVTNNKVIEVLQYLGEKFGIAVNWTSENIIPYINTLVQKIATYVFYSSLFWAILCLIIFVACLIFLIYLIKCIAHYEKANFYDEDLDFIVGILAVMCVIGIIVSPIVMVAEIDSVIKAKTLPEMVAIEYLQDVTK